MIKINLLDYREELDKIKIQKHVMSAIAVFGILLFLIFVYTLFEWSELDALKQENQEVESQVRAIEPQARKVMKMEKKIKRIDQIVTEIEKMRIGQNQIAMILSDLNSAIPLDIWLKSVTEMTKKEIKEANLPISFEGGTDKIIRIIGFSLTTDAPLNYRKELEKLPYFKTVLIYKVNEEIKNNARYYGFQVYCHLEGKSGKEEEG